MLNREDWIMIRDMRKKGCYLREIALQVGCSERTVRRALKRGGPPPRRKSGVRASKLDPYKPQVDQLLSEGVWNAEVIFAEIRAQGYQGGRSILRDYIRPKRALRKALGTVRFETAPGKQLQSDWGKITTVVAGNRTKVHFAVNLLGYSRRFHVWAALCEDAEHTYESLVRAFEWFGGVPQEVWVDNQKAAVLSHAPNGKVRFNPGFVQLAEHYGFKPKACRPYRPQTKGKDERMVRYVKENFFQRYRSFESLAHLNQQLEQWLAEVADERIHGTLKARVHDRFVKERPRLQPLPPVRFSTCYQECRRVALDAFIDVCGNRYSVPAHLCGERVVIHRYLDGGLKVFDAQGRLVAEHQLRPAIEGWQVVPDHHARLWRDLGVQTRSLAAYEEASTWS
ncbi:MAG: IS21 family transposase [Gammaproteobacteria bacterium]|nr:MAG: IS21 family transposase [Gammaproteobacteria bacterium]